MKKNNSKRKNNVECIRKVKCTKKNNKNKTKEKYPHFRYYLKSKHPALIVGEQISKKNGEEYKYRKVMHGEKDGRHWNEEVFPNPKPGDNRPMHIAKRVRHDKKTNFEPYALSWKYPEEKNKQKNSNPTGKV